MRENIKTRPPFAVDASVYKEAIKAFAMDNNIDKSCHIEVVEGKVIQYLMLEDSYAKRDCEANQFIVFDYSKRNPLNYNAAVEIYEFK